MQHFFVTPAQVKGDVILIDGSDVRHIGYALRMKIGEKLVISDGNNHRYLCRIDRISEKEVRAKILSEEERDTELPLRIYLFQGLPKGDKMERIIKSSAELGAYEIIPTVTKRAIVRPAKEKEERRVKRWQEIARGAAKQSARGVIPRVSEIMDYERALSYAGKLDVLLIPYELAADMGRTRRILESEIKKGASVGIFIGPEGGFEKEEEAAALAAGAKEITLGRRILRTETAGPALLSILMYLWED